MTRTLILPAIACLAASMCAADNAALAAGRVIITEIMYNPNSKEDRGQTEWIEIANVGDEAVVIKDWRIDDEDKWDWSRFSCTLEPGGVAVLINADFVTEEQFRAAWDLPSSEGGLNYQVIPVKWGGIANTPGPDNEILQLLNDKDEVICEVHQVGEWPDCTRPDGPSIYLTDLTATDLSNGKLWRRSDVGVAGARNNRKTEIFNGVDIGSPGFVPGLQGGPVAAAPKPADKTEEGAAAAPKPKPGNVIDY